MVTTKQLRRLFVRNESTRSVAELQEQMSACRKALTFFSDKDEPTAAGDDVDTTSDNDSVRGWAVWARGRLIAADREMAKGRVYTHG